MKRPTLSHGRHKEITICLADEHGYYFDAYASSLRYKSVPEALKDIERLQRQGYKARMFRITTRITTWKEREYSNW